MKSIFQYISESQPNFKPVKLQCEFICDFSLNKTRCFVKLPKESAIPWPESWEELQNNRWIEGGDLFDSESGSQICPKAQLKFKLDSGEEFKIDRNIIWQFDGHGDSWGVITGPGHRFEVNKPFTKLELIAVTNTSLGEYVIGTITPKYPQELTFDLKLRHYSSRIKKGGQFVRLDSQWKITKEAGRKEGLGNDVTVMFGKYYGMKISELCASNPEYAAYLMTITSVGSDTANSNLQSCQSYIDKNLDWKEIRVAQRTEAEKRAAVALPKGTVIDFEGTCQTVETKYNRAASYLPQAQQDRINFEYILIKCNNGMTLRSNKRVRGLTGKVKGTATIDWYSGGSDTYGIVDVKNIQKIN